MGPEPHYTVAPPVAGDLEGAIGNTPLIRLRRASEATDCTILGKAEFMNPGGSVKDRAALAIIVDAERRGVLKPGGTVVEGTAGNTGIGLTLVGNARGYRTVIVMPETQIAREDRLPAHDRRRSAAGAGQALPRSRQLRACLPPSRRGTRRGVGQPVRQPGQPRRPPRAPPARRSGTRPPGGSTPSPAPAAPAARWPAWRWR